MVDRSRAVVDFLGANGWGGAERAHLAGDASSRSYQRLRLGRKTAVFMDTPAGSVDSPAAFVHIAKHLIGCGLSAPRILAQDLEAGFLLLEDLGDRLFSRVLQADPTQEPILYQSAVDALLHLHDADPPGAVPDLSPRDWAEAASLAIEWYVFAITGVQQDSAEMIAGLAAILTRFANGPRVLILRDFHAENLIWLPERTGVARVGLLDFQLAQLGQPGYDLVSLLQDARRDVRPETESALLLRFCETRRLDRHAFSASYAALGTQRALRILGIFSRLCLSSGKPGYLRLIPRVWAQLQRNLAHPELAGFAKTCAGLLPVPNPENLGKIENQCSVVPFP